MTHSTMPIPCSVRLLSDLHILVQQELLINLTSGQDIKIFFFQNYVNQLSSYTKFQNN